MEQLSIKLRNPLDKLGEPAHTPVRLDLSPLSQLRVIRLTACWNKLDIDTFTLNPRSMIAHLEIACQSSAASVVRHMISLCPELETCIIHVALQPDNAPVPLITLESPVTYVHISCLGEASEILEGVRFPKLQTLTIHEIACRPDAHERTHSVFSALSRALMPVLSAVSLTVAPFDIDYLPNLALIPTLVSLDLPHLTPGTTFEHISSTMALLADAKSLPALEDVSLSLSLMPHELDAADLKLANTTLMSILKSHMQTLQRIYVSLPGLTADWTPDLSGIPKFVPEGHYDTPEWVLRLWPHHPDDNRCMGYDTFRVEMPYVPDDYPWVLCDQDIEANEPSLPGLWS